MPLPDSPAAPIVFHRADAFHVEKNDVDMWIYGGVDAVAPVAVAYQETATGHAQEFRHHTSAFVFYVIEGAGEWVVDGVVLPVQATDVVVVPPGAAFYYRGDLKQVCLTAPAWTEEDEEVLRQLDL